MYKKACCMSKVIVLLIKPIVFLTFLLPSATLDLKVPISGAPRACERSLIATTIYPSEKIWQSLDLKPTDRPSVRTTGKPMFNPTPYS